MLAGAMLCTLYYIFTPGKYVCRWGYRGPGRGRDSKLGSPASFSGRVRMQTPGAGGHGMPGPLGQHRAGVEQLLWCPIPAGASGSYSPLCPPALPAVSATPGTHVPCGNLTSLVLSSKETAGRWGMGDKGRVGSRAPARKQEPAGQGESSSLHLLWDLEFLGLGLL